MNVVARKSTLESPLCILKTTMDEGACFTKVGLADGPRRREGVHSQALLITYVEEGRGKKRG